MMEIRFKLDGNFDAALIARIRDKANGAGENTAARFLLRHWFENEVQQGSPQVRQYDDAVVSDLGQDNATATAELQAACNAISDEW